MEQYDTNIELYYLLMYTSDRWYTLTNVNIFQDKIKK
jgi:hypothetical protein